MHNNNRFIPYDGFKMVILAVLLFSLMLLVWQGSTPTNPQSEGLVSQASSLSPTEIVAEITPKADPESPELGDSLEAALPAGFTIEMDESGVWYIISAEGDILYYFDEAGQKWEALMLAMEDAEEAAEDASGISCPLANPPRIAELGDVVRVVNAEIPLRDTPEAGGNNFIMLLSHDTLLEVIGSPVCTPYLAGANVWWPVRTSNGVEGFAAEGSAISDVYYLELVK